MIIYTIGHSNRPLEELVEILRSAAISTLADIRRFPGSRRNPHFSRAALEKSLPEHGINYFHIEQLGGHRKPVPDSVHTGLRNNSFRAYADHMMTAEFRRGVEILPGLEKPVAVMCAEAVPWRCHRNLLSDWLVRHGHTVIHLISVSGRREHEAMGISTLRDGHVLYPEPRQAQDTLPFSEGEGDEG